MKYRTGIGINVVVLASLGLIVLAASGILVQTGSDDISNTAAERTAESQCDTWEERSLTAGTDETDEAERKYNQNCEGTLDEIVGDDGNFFGSDYDPDQHEDNSFFDWGDSSSGFGGGGDGTATNIEEGESKEVEAVQGAITYVGRDRDTVSEKVHLRYDPNGDMQNSVTGSAVGDVGCQIGNENTMTGVPLDELSSDVTECAHSAVVDTMVGMMKFSICTADDANTVKIAIGQPTESGSEICERYRNIELD